MAVKTDTEVIIGGRVLTLSGYESEEYLQKVASYINNKLAEYNRVESFRRQPADIQNILVELNIADDYFKAKKQIEEMEEDTVVNLGFDKALLYKNMVAADADWLYELEEWNDIFDEETRKKLYKEQKSSTTIVKEAKIYPNDPCPCGSGKKYRKCCGKNK